MLDARIQKQVIQYRVHQIKWSAELYTLCSIAFFWFLDISLFPQENLLIIYCLSPAHPGLKALHQWRHLATAATPQLVDHFRSSKKSVFECKFVPFVSNRNINISRAKLYSTWDLVIKVTSLFIANLSQHLDWSISGRRTGIFTLLCFLHSN